MQKNLLAHQLSLLWLLYRRSFLFCSFFLFIFLSHIGRAQVNTIFYVPLPEQDLYDAFDVFSNPSQTIFGVISVVVAEDNTIIYYDHWEDGYETDINIKTQSSTQIWGDNNPANGIPPGYVAILGNKYDESYHVPELVQDMDISFVGIKTGDVSGSLSADVVTAQSRKLSEMTWTYDISQNDREMIISIVAEKDMDLNGFQTEFNWPAEMNFMCINGKNLPISGNNVRMEVVNKRSLPVVFHNAVGIKVKKGTVLFTLSFLPGTQTEDIQLRQTNKRMNGEVYTRDGVHALHLKKGITDEGLMLVLMQNKPNPWAESTVIEAQIPFSGVATLRVHDIQNRLVYTNSIIIIPGNHKFNIGYDDIKVSGLYFYEIEINGITTRNKMIRVK